MPLSCTQKDSRIKVSSLGLQMGRKPKAGVYEEAGQDSAEPEPTGAKENTGGQWHWWEQSHKEKG